MPCLRCRSGSAFAISTCSNRLSGHRLTLRRAFPLPEGINPGIGSIDVALANVDRRCGHDPPQCRSPVSQGTGILPAVPVPGIRPGPFTSSRIGAGVREDGTRFNGGL